MGVDGEGIGHYDGMTFFVKDALIGDVIRARAIKLKKNYGYARVEEILKPSAFRVAPKCELHRRCGGCQIQALSYEKQLEFKEQKVRNNLIRIGGFSSEEVDAKMLPVVGMEEPFRYRNKAQFPVGYDKEGNVITGFYAARTHSIIPVEDCLLGVKDNELILTLIKGWMKDCNVSAYDETTGKGLVRHVLIRYGFTTKEIMVCLIINGDKIPGEEYLINTLKRVEGMTSISINMNKKNTGSSRCFLFAFYSRLDTLQSIFHGGVILRRDRLNEALLVGFHRLSDPQDLYVPLFIHGVNGSVAVAGDSGIPGVVVFRDL